MPMLDKHLKYDPKRLEGWEPKHWDFKNKNSSTGYQGNGRKKKGPAHTKSPQSLRRKARSLAKRKHA